MFRFVVASTCQHKPKSDLIPQPPLQRRGRASITFNSSDAKISKIVGTIFWKILGFVVLSACQNEPKKVPPLPAEKMIQVLIDIHLAEAQIPNLVLTPDSSYFLNRAFERKVFAKHKIDSTTYYQAYAYYLENIAEFEKIYAVVVDSLVYRESMHNLGKPLDTVQKKNTPSLVPIQPPVDSSGLELKKQLRKKLLKNRIGDLSI